MPVVDELVPTLLADVLVVGVHGGLGLVHGGGNDLVEELLIKVGVVIGHGGLADLSGDGPDERHLLFDLLVGLHDGVIHDIVGQLLGAGLDHDDLLLGGGHGEVQLGGVLLLLIGVEDDLAVHIDHLQAADGAGPGNLGIGEAGGHADHGGHLGRAVVVHAHDGACHHHVVAEVIGEEGADGAVDDAAGQYRRQRGLALAAHKRAGDAAHGVELLLKIHAQGEEVHAVTGTGRDGDGHQYGGLAIGDHGGRAGQLGHLAHVDGQRAAAQVHLVDLVVGKLLVSDDG